MPDNLREFHFPLSRFSCFCANSVSGFEEFSICCGKVVRLAGLEPANECFSSLLIVAFLCGNLHLLIRTKHLLTKCKCAFRCNLEQENLCGIVR